MNSMIAALTGDLAWPLAVAFAWVLGEFGHHRTGLPRISFYGLVGFALGHAQAGWLTASASGTAMLVANSAFGLILFEIGYRLNLRWLRSNAWIGVTGLLEAAVTFVAVYLVARAFATPTLPALLLASLAMSTSPAAVIRVINEQRSGGQVTERVLHLTAINCLLSIFAFQSILGVSTFQSSGDLWRAMSNSLLVLGASTGLGALFGVAVPALLRHLGRLTQDATVGFAIGVLLLVALTHSLQLSPVLASLTFGCFARHRRVVLNQTQRNFGALGDLLAIVMFVFVGSTIAWQQVGEGFVLALLLIGVRLLAKVCVVTGLARVSGVSTTKGLLTGLAMTPISVFVILILEHTRVLGMDLFEQLAPLAAATLLLDLFGPIVTQQALKLAGETNEPTQA